MIAQSASHTPVRVKRERASARVATKGGRFPTLAGWENPGNWMSLELFSERCYTRSTEIPFPLDNRPTLHSHAQFDLSPRVSAEEPQPVFTTDRQARDNKIPDGCCRITDPDTKVGLWQAQACNMRSNCRCSCVLQFTFCHAFSCVLHRPPSQLIHCMALYQFHLPVFPPEELFFFFLIRFACAQIYSPTRLWLCKKPVRATIKLADQRNPCRQAENALPKKCVTFSAVYEQAAPTIYPLS
jgi:hypothetical protein